jgi:hypothetical protein
MSDSGTAPTEGYEVDYTYAPVGLFVLPICIGSLALGLYAFFLNYLVTKGIYAPYIVDGQRTLFRDDVKGVVDGALVMLALFVMSLLLAFVGRATVVAGKKVDHLWVVGWCGIPVLAVVLAIIATVANH